MRRQTGLELLDAEDWKGKLREVSGQKAPTAENLRHVADRYALMKAQVTLVQKAPEDGERVLEFVISDGSVDRDYDTIRPKGWVLRAYKQNPVVLWAHDGRVPPIARSLSVKVESEQLIARAEFCPFDLNPFGDMIFRMYAEGYMRTASVGFRGLEMTPAADDEERQRRYGLDFLKQELLEWSAVPVPANSNALMRAHEAGINTRPLKSWAEMVLDLKQPLAGIGMNDVEQAWAAVRGPRKLYVWFEASEEPEETTAVEPEESEPPIGEPAPPAADPTPEPEVEVPPAADPIAPAATASHEITFRRRAEGDYEVLRGGQPIAVVEQVDSIEWDETGILRLRSVTPEADLSDYVIELDEPASEQAAAEDEDTLEIEEPEAPSAPVEDAPPSTDEMIRAVGQAVREALAAALAPRA